MAITKEEYQVFKFFKNTYTKINCAKVIKILPTLDIVLEGCKNEEFFIMSGKILEENMFFSYLKDNNLSTVITVEQWKTLSECLKKNITALSLENVVLANFSFKDADGNDSEISLELTPGYPEGIEKWKNITKKLPAKEENISGLLNDEIIEVFEDEEGNITWLHTDKKIIEIPKSRVLSLQRGCSAFLRYIQPEDSNIKYVAISSSSELLTLEQIFATL